MDSSAKVTDLAKIFGLYILGSETIRTKKERLYFSSLSTFRFNIALRLSGVLIGDEMTGDEMPCFCKMMSEKIR
jgi:hypothetical protein